MTRIHQAAAIMLLRPQGPGLQAGPGPDPGLPSQSDRIPTAESGWPGAGDLNSNIRIRVILPGRPGAGRLPPVTVTAPNLELATGIRVGPAFKLVGITAATPSQRS